MFRSEIFLGLLVRCYRIACCDCYTGKGKSLCVHARPIHGARHSLRGFVATEDKHLSHSLIEDKKQLCESARQGQP